MSSSSCCKLIYHFFFLIFFSGFIIAEDSYDELIEALKNTLNSLGPQASGYINTLVSNTKKETMAQESGDRCELVHVLEDGAVDTAEGAYHTISNPELYELASEEAPYRLAALADAVEDGTADGEDVENLVENFNTEIREATDQPL